MTVLNVCRSKQGLEEWRNQAKLKQKLILRDGAEHSYVKAIENAPFAIDIIKIPSQTDTLEEADPPGSNLEVGVDREVVEKFRSRLEDKRRQVGIIINPSAELQEAEKNLAEVNACPSPVSLCSLRVTCLTPGHGYAGGVGEQKN